MVLSEVKDSATNWPIYFGDEKMRFSPRKFREMFAASGMEKKQLRWEVIGEHEQDDVRIDRYLDGKLSPKLPAIRKMAKAFGCAVRDLCEEIK